MAAVAAVLVAVACGVPEPPERAGLGPGEVLVDDPGVEALDEALRSLEDRGMAGVVLLQVGDEVLLHRAYGWADAEAGVPMTVDRGFDIGSLVKPIHLAAILKAMDDGLLTPDDTLGRFLPEVPPDKAGITIRHLATHSAGLRDMFGDDYDVVSRDWILEQVLGSRLLYRPGEDSKYSNSGYSLMAILLEEASGKPFEQYVRESVLLPAGVERIGYVLAGWTADELAVGTTRWGGRWGTPLDHAWADDGPGWNLRGNGGMLARAQDVNAWYRALFHGEVLSPQSFDLFMAVDGRESGALGGRMVGHAGSNGIFESLHFSYEDYDAHLTVLTSSARQPAENIWPEFRAHFFDLLRAGDQE